MDILRRAAESLMDQRSLVCEQERVDQELLDAANEILHRHENH